MTLRFPRKVAFQMSASTSRFYKIAELSMTKSRSIELEFRPVQLNPECIRRSAYSGASFPAGTPRLSGVNFHNFCSAIGYALLGISMR